eukprot:comp23047_c0_seq1/m.36889 comp23047_c0_seq1/g.36889  ORF comp23047_c0_seq1/g.36889 comp23047_c0_seq1/m.36889 type:complete len:495 (-) comp23047_c0_seq1:343-1827(-)
MRRHKQGEGWTWVPTHVTSLISSVRPCITILALGATSLLAYSYGHTHVHSLWTQSPQVQILHNPTLQLQHSQNETRPPEPIMLGTQKLEQHQNMRLGMSLPTVTLTVTEIAPTHGLVQNSTTSPSQFSSGDGVPQPLLRSSNVSEGQEGESGFDYEGFLVESLARNNTVAGKRVFLMLVTRFGQGMGRYRAHMDMRLALFGTFAFPSVKAQQGPFLWVIFADPDMFSDQKQKFLDIIRPLRHRIVIIWTNRCAHSLNPIRYKPIIDAHLKSFLQRVDSLYDTIITTRLDADDVMHPSTLALTRGAARNVSTPFMRVRWRRGYAWRPGGEEGLGLVNSYMFASLAIGTSLLSDGAYSPLAHNVHGMSHVRMLPAIYDRCNQYRMPTDTRPCYNDTRADIVLHGHGWLYVRTAISDSDSGQEENDPKLLDAVPDGEVRPLLSEFGLDPERVEAFNLLLPEYNKRLAAEPVNTPPSCGFFRRMGNPKYHKEGEEMNQ